MEEDEIGVLGEEERLLTCLCIMGRQCKEGSKMRLKMNQCV